ncbi:hypothetical protein [Oligoflexus tunisiensis]|uniref:hypothetical protein n=1 Tax=Oligoflexus tunisiensis TaxID=708132 RepID=UPI00114D2358|nr:hypothetical protein [Oligoflexus tunisiensis]
MKCCQTFAFILPLLVPMACQGKKDETRYRYIENQTNVGKPPDQPITPTCKPELQVLCSEIQAKIDAKEQEVKTLAEAGDVNALYVAQLDLNELMEIRDSYLKGQLDVTSIQERYASLRQILAAHDEDEPISISYQKEETDAVREVFEAFGELTIDPAIIADSATDRSKTVTYSTPEGETPWAAYWYPKLGKEMYEGENSPLWKLDAWLATQGLASQSVGWENEHYDSGVAGWEGLCDAWAMASILTSEPQRGVTVDGITFTTADLKAIAIKYYEGYKPRIFGRRYQGLAATDGLIQDLRPEAFHRLIEEFLGHQKKPLIIDEEPGPEIWSKPLFRMAFNIHKDPHKPQALIVKAFPWMIRQRPGVNGSSTSLASDLAAPAYEYRLYYDARPTADGRLKILAGEWLSSSVNFHPDMVFLPNGMDNKDQPNPEIHKHGDAIRKLLKLAGMIKP